MKKIPIIGTQTLNSINNVKKLISSIDYPTEILSIIVNNENFDILLDLHNYCKDNKNEYIEKIEISFHPTNLGCPASWNYHFKQYPYADFFIKPDDDIIFGSGDLEKMVKLIEDGNDLVFFQDGPTKYACFGITKHTLKTVGLFDENYFPCNYEDDDYNVRVKMLNIKEDIIKSSGHHETCGTYKNLQDHKIEHGKLSEFIITTSEYFFKKWGNRYPNNYQYPFNDEKNNYNNISYDFSYRENKIFRCNYTK
jgi:hypothetical protein